MPSTSVEDYLKTIYALQEKESIAKTGALAENLGISSGSVSEMLKRMAGMSPPLIDYRQHHGATLTRQGRLKAMAVIRRHRLLETFLYRILKLDWDSVHEEAETLEHHLSERVVHAMDALLSHPKRDPHGEPIPDGSGVMSSPIGEKLTFLNPGEKFRIVRVDPGMPSVSGSDLAIISLCKRNFSQNKYVDPLRPCFHIPKYPCTASAILLVHDSLLFQPVGGPWP